MTLSKTGDRVTIITDNKLCLLAPDVVVGYCSIAMATAGGSKFDETSNKIVNFYSLKSSINK